uniref:Chalcone synthase n=1 Tax=Aegilops tauschii TaxID=37682 RepID=N1R3C1_AEGTA
MASSSSIPATTVREIRVRYPNAGSHAPGTDVRLVSLLGLRHDVLAHRLQLNGCASGCAALRLAKDLAENNRGARILVACVELTVTAFRAPHEADTFDTLIPQGLFGDGAGAVIVGADPDVHERPLFEMVSASQYVIPDTEHMPTMQLGRAIIQGVVHWNNLFWAVHPGSSAMLDHIVTALRLAPGKLAASRTVVREFGNMLGATVIFVLDEVRRQRVDRDGEGAAADEDWGVMMGFGPGFTVETMLLHAAT